MELRMLLARLTWEFDLEVAHGVKEPDYRFGFVHHAYGMHMKATRRCQTTDTSGEVSRID